jgi:hypothetical protein
MNQRYQRQDVQCVLFGHGPIRLGRMGQRIAHGAKQADQQVGKAFLLALFGLGGERSQGENGLLACECLVHQVRAIAVQARQQANPLRNTFRCLEHGMEVVFVQQLGAAVVQHFRMDDAAFQRGLESSRAGASGIKRRGLVGVPDLAVFAHVEEPEKARTTSVTDAVSEEVKVWQARPLDAIYPIVYLDCIHVKVREGAVRVKAVYLAIGINMNGEKEVLGLWLAQTEGAKFWLQVVTELRNRGVQDIFIACVDGLKGFPDAIEAVFPKAVVQLCIVHMVRHSLNYVSWKRRKEVAADLRHIYQAATVEEAELRLGEFEAKWDADYLPIEFVAPPGERRRVAGVVHRVHRAIDEHDEMVADLVLVLRAGQRIEQPLPLGHAGRRVGNLDFLQQALDLRAAQAALGIGEHAARGFKML